jgi:hypothetical protein
MHAELTTLTDETVDIWTDVMDSALQYVLSSFLVQQHLIYDFEDHGVFCPAPKGFRSRQYTIMI